MKKKLILYGCGQLGEEWLKGLGEGNVYGFADSDPKKIGKRFGNKEIFSIEQLVNMREQIAIFISTESRYKNEIYRVLKDFGLAENIVGTPYIDKNLFVDWTAQIDIQTKFEGRNALSPGAAVFNCQIGYASYISCNSFFSNTKIGRYSCIGPNVKIILGQHPTRNFVSIHPMFYSTQQTIHKTFVSENLFEEFRYTKNGYSVEIGNDVWIGNGVTIMEGVSIADGTIVAAGTNVVKDTEPYAIVGGNPARTIRFRFDTDEIEFLTKLKWWNKDYVWVAEHAQYFSDIKKFKKLVEDEKSN